MCIRDRFRRSNLAVGQYNSNIFSKNFFSVLFFGSGGSATTKLMAAIFSKNFLGRNFSEGASQASHGLPANYLVRIFRA